MSQNGIFWHEGDTSDYFTRTIYLYIDGFLKGFVAESGELGWLAFQFSVKLQYPHMSLEEAKDVLMAACMEEGGN